MAWIRLRFLIAAAAMIACLDGGSLDAAERPHGDLIGQAETYFALDEDTLPDLALDHDLGYTEILAANRGVDPWLPGAGTPILLPKMYILPSAPRRGIVINLADQRLYHYRQDGSVQSYPIGIAATGTTYRTGSTRIVTKREHPTWIPTASVRAEDPTLPAAVPPGSDNPLGDYALNTDWDSIVIHGTNRPYGIGRRVSHGCFRLYPQDIAELYRLVAIGTPVAVVDQPIKVGWRDEELYLEVHPTLEQADQLESEGYFEPIPVFGLARLILDGAGVDPDLVDWVKVEKIVEERTGFPIQILK